MADPEGENGAEVLEECNDEIAEDSRDGFESAALLAAAAADEERFDGDEEPSERREESDDDDHVPQQADRQEEEVVSDADYVQSEQEEEPQSDASDQRRNSSSPEERRRKKHGRRKISQEQLELLSIANACRRSARQRNQIQRYAVGGDSDSDERPKKRRSRRHEGSDDYSESGSSGEASGSGSDYSKPKKRGKRGRPRKRVADSSEDEWSDERRRSERRQVKAKVNYREQESDAEINDDDVLEWAEEEPIASAADQTPTEAIEKVLKHRLGRKGAVGHQTTVYNVEDRRDPNDGFDPEKEEGERQFLIKWVGWSHLHNTWESIESLRNANVKGMKKHDNYMKRVKEIDKWKKTADKDYIEYFDCEQEMSEQLYEQYKNVERIIAHQMSKDSTDVNDYYVKWSCLPYSECTWEDSSLIARWFQDKLDQYHSRIKSQKTPSKLSSALRKRPRFVPVQEQPSYIGTGDCVLRDYQLEGLNWLLSTWCRKNSVILADEMGLGKTIQCISFLSVLFHEYEVHGPFLIVVPLSTMASWQKELETWAPDINAVVYLGDVSSRDLIRQFEIFKFDTRRLKANCLLTTYEILLKDKSFLGGFDWAMLIVDEAHRLKNNESLLFRSMKDFNSNHRLLITGTPLQNSLKELWALLHFIMPEKFEYWDDFEEKHHETEVHRGLAHLHEELKPFLLRRIKKDVEKSLPAKVEQILRVDMTAVQKQYYKWILTKNYRELSKGVKGSIAGFINLVMELKKCCNHASLIRLPDFEFNAPQERMQQILKSSGKLILLDKLLCRLRETGHRVLIFSQMVMMLDIIEEYLKLRRFSFQRLDGSIRGDLRKQALDHFNAPNSQDFCFLLSTRAGGLGINLATADTVVIFDSDWNPQNDLQAQSRAHRIGQTRQVNIYRLVTKASVEEDIVERAKKKLVLDHLVIQRMDTTGRTVLSKHAISNATSGVPFDKQELSSILKFGAEELFKEEEEGEEPEVDIDDILQRAETRELENQTNNNELLDAFKVANFAIDEEKDIREQLNWDEIIPEDERKKIELEEKQQWEAQFLLGPRQRKEIQQMARNEDSDDDWNSKRTKRKRAADDSDSESSDDERPKKRSKKTHCGFTDGEIRKVIKSFRKFADPINRLDTILTDAELGESEIDIKQLRQLCDELVKGCQDALRDANKTNNNQTAPSQEDGKKKQDRGPTFKLGGIDVYVRPIMKMQSDLQPLYHVMPRDKSERKHFNIPIKPKPVKTWDVEWEDSDDSCLLRGIYEYGMGSWDQIKMDPELGLTEKVMLMDKNKKPQSKHVQSRAEYLLKLLHKHLKATNPSTVLTISNGAPPEKEKPRQKKTDTGATKTPRKVAAQPTAPRAKTVKQEAVKPSPPTKSVKKEALNSDAIRAKIVDLAVLKKYASELDDRRGKTFQKCVEVTRPVLKYMRRLVKTDDQTGSRNLLKVGDHICTYLITKATNDKSLQKWHSYLWSFLSAFTQQDAGKLARNYCKAHEEQTAAGTPAPSHSNHHRKKHEQNSERKTKHHHQQQQHHQQHHHQQQHHHSDKHHYNDDERKRHRSPSRHGAGEYEEGRGRSSEHNWSHSRYEEPRYMQKRERMAYNDPPGWQNNNGNTDRDRDRQRWDRHRNR